MPHLHIYSPLKQSNLSLVEGMDMTHSFPLHTHHSLIIGLVTAGTRQMLYPDGNLVVHRGEIFIVHPGEPHTCCTDYIQPMDYRVLCIPPDLLQTIFPAGLTFPHKLANPQATTALLDCFRQLDGVCKEDAKEHILITFIHYLVSNWATPTHSPALPPPVSQAQQYLDDHLTERVDIQILGKAVCLSPYHLNRLFRLRLGLPPHTYQLQAKIHRAQSLLSQGLSPVQTALELGFSDQSHFSRFFKKYIGLTPANYQRQNREAP